MNALALTDRPNVSAAADKLPALGGQPPLSPHPELFVVCAVAESQGRAHGWWIDAAQPVEDLELAIGAMLATSPAAPSNAYLIRNWRGFGAMRLSPLTPIDELSRLALAVCSHGADFVCALTRRLDSDGAALAALDEYAGAYPSLAAFGAAIAEERYGGHALLLPEQYYEALAASTIDAGEAFAIRVAALLGDDLHCFWSV